MTINPGDEFKIQASPSQELLRKLVYLATQGSDSVLTGAVRSGTAAVKGSGREKEGTRADMLLQLARLADPQYQALSARINDELDLMDEASVLALQEIEEELLELRRERERLLEQACRDEHGHRVFMTEDESAAFYQDGTRLENDDFEPLRDRLHGKPTWEEWQDSYDREEGLNAEREQIHEHEAQREDLREDLAKGAVSKEEAEQREQEIESSLPERVRGSYDALKAQSADNGAGPDSGLSAEEAAFLDVRADTAKAAGAGTPAREGADAQPAADPPPPGASPLQPR